MGQINELKDFTRGQLDAVLMKIGHDVGVGTAEGINAFLRGELTIARTTAKWREADGVIYFTVTSDGTTGERWIARLEKKGFRLSDYAKSVLRHRKFKPTTGVSTEIAVLKGELFTDDDRITKNVRALARKRKLTKPNTEAACLIREKFSDKELEEMGLWAIIAMHDPTPDSDGDPSLLGADRYDDFRCLSAYDGNLDDEWNRDDGFAFAVAPGTLT